MKKNHTGESRLSLKTHPPQFQQAQGMCAVLCVFVLAHMCVCFAQGSGGRVLPTITHGTGGGTKKNTHRHNCHSENEGMAQRDKK